MADRMPKELLERFKRKQEGTSEGEKPSEGSKDAQKEALRKARKAKLMQKREKQKINR
jgi:hypothetical protein